MIKILADEGPKSATVKHAKDSNVKRLELLRCRKERRDLAGVILLKKCGKHLQILLVHQRKKNTLHWSIPKGGLDASESKEEAARRETREETGIEAGALQYAGTVCYGNKKPKSVACFVGFVRDECEVRHCTKEIDQVAFVEIEFACRLVHEAQADLIRAFVGQLSAAMSG